MSQSLRLPPRLRAGYRPQRHRLLLALLRRRRSRGPRMRRRRHSWRRRRLPLPPQRKRPSRETLERLCGRRSTQRVVAGCCGPSMFRRCGDPCMRRRVWTCGGGGAADHQLPTARQDAGIGRLGRPRQTSGPGRFAEWQHRGRRAPSSRGCGIVDRQRPPRCTRRRYPAHPHHVAPCTRAAAAHGRWASHPGGVYHLLTERLCVLGRADGGLCVVQRLRGSWGGRGVHYCAQTGVS